MAGRHALKSNGLNRGYLSAGEGGGGQGTIVHNTSLLSAMDSTSHNDDRKLTGGHVTWRASEARIGGDTLLKGDLNLKLHIHRPTGMNGKNSLHELTSEPAYSYVLTRLL